MTTATHPIHKLKIQSLEALEALAAALRAIDIEINSASAPLSDSMEDRGIDTTSLPIDEYCDSNFDTAEIFSWAVPSPEHGNRPRYLLVDCDTTGKSWGILDLEDDAPDEWPRKEVWAGQEADSTPEEAVAASTQTSYVLNMPSQLHLRLKLISARETITIREIILTAIDEHMVARLRT